MTDLNDGHASSLAPQLLVDLIFNGKTMTVPARNIVTVKAAHEFRLHNKIFKNLIQGSTDVDMTVRIRRTIVENILRPSAGSLEDFPIDALLIPFMEKLRLPL